MFIAIILGILVISIGAVLIYKNNQGTVAKVENDVAEVKKDATEIKDIVK
jgi:hypothetical protein